MFCEFDKLKVIFLDNSEISINGIINALFSSIAWDVGTTGAVALKSRFVSALEV